MLTRNWKIPMYPTKNQMSIGSQPPNRGESERERLSEKESETDMLKPGSSCAREIFCGLIATNRAFIQHS